MKKEQYTYTDFTNVMSAIVEKKKAAESIIKKVIQELEEETGMSVTSVNAEGKKYYTESSETPVFKSWNVKIELGLETAINL